MQKIISTIILSVLMISQMSAQTIFWGGPGNKDSEFNGGLNAWTTEGLASAVKDSAKNAVWTYSKTANAAPFIFGGGTPSANVAVNSKSKANGAAVFNSAYLETRGVFANIGTGKGPAPCYPKGSTNITSGTTATQIGVLTSPIIDCSAQTTVGVWFYQLYYKFNGTTSIEVTHDGGTTWQEFPINMVSPAVNGNVNNRLLVDISSAAAGFANVQFRFKWSGGLYFWVIDDVYLANLPDNDLSISQPFYTPGSYATPLSQICGDTFVIQATVSNKGGKTQQNLVLAGYVTDVSGKLYFADSIIIDDLAPGTSDTVVTNGRFDPKDLPVGEYKITWRTYTPGATDATTADNTMSAKFEVTESTFAKEPIADDDVRAGGHYLYGNQFRTSNCWNPKDEFYATQATIQLTSTSSSGGAGSLEGYQVVVYVLKVKDDVLSDFSNFETTKDINAADGSLEIVGLGDYTCAGEADFDDINVPLLDFDGKKLRLDPSTRYFVVVDHPAEQTGADVVRHAANLTGFKDFAMATFNTPVYVEAQGRWFTGFTGNPQPVVRLGIENTFVGNKDIKQLDVNSLKIKTNPVVNKTLDLTINLDKTSDANLMIMDLQGRVISSTDLQSVQTKDMSLDVSSCKAGNYFVKLSTKDGIRTLQFNVAK